MKRAAVRMTIEVYVEVDDTGEFTDMVEQAKAELRKRVVEAKGFYPFRSVCNTVHPDVTVEEMKHHTLVEPKGKWK